MNKRERNCCEDCCDNPECCPGHPHKSARQERNAPDKAQGATAQARPWHREQLKGPPRIVDAYGLRVCTMRDRDIRADEDARATEANARLIVKAVNERDALLQALKREHRTETFDDSDCETCRIIREAESE